MIIQAKTRNGGILEFDGFEELSEKIPSIANKIEEILFVDDGGTVMKAVPFIGNKFELHVVDEDGVAHRI